MADSNYTIEFDTGSAAANVDKLIEGIRQLAGASQQSFSAADAAARKFEQGLAGYARSLNAGGASLNSNSQAASRAAAAQQQFANATTSAGNASARAAQQHQQHAQSAAGLSNAFSGASGSAAGLIGALGMLGKAAAGATAFSFLKGQIAEVIESMNDYNKTMARLRFSNDGDTLKAAQDYQFLIDTADKLGLKLKDVSDGYTKFAAAASQSGMTAAQTKTTFTSLAEASKVLGLTSFETRLTMSALTQMASKQKVSMEELRQQMGEKLPVAMIAAARATGLTTKQFNEQLSKGTLDITSFFAAFADELHKMAEKELPNATASLESELNRLDNTIELMRRQAGDSGFGDSLVKGLRLLIDTLRDPAIQSGFQAVMGGFTLLTSGAVKLAGVVADTFKGMVPAALEFAEKAGIGFAGFFFKIEEGILRLGVQWQRLLGNMSVEMMKQKLSELDGYAQSRIKAMGESLAAEQRTKSGLPPVPAGLDGMAPTMPSKERSNLLKQYERRPEPVPRATIVPKPKAARSSAAADPMDAALKSYETAEAEAQLRINAAIRARKLAELEADLARENITYQDYLSKRAQLEQDSVDEQIRIQQKLKTEREAALAKAASGSEKKDLAEAKRIQGELLKIDGQLTALREKKVEIDIKLGADNAKVKREVEKFLAELDAAFAEMSGDKFGAARARIQQRLADQLRDPKNQNAATQAALRRNANMEQLRADYEEATYAFNLQKRLLDSTIQQNDDQVRRGEITAIAAERNILQAREDVRDAMQRQLDKAKELAEAIKDPEALAAVRELELTFKNLSDTTDQFSRDLKAGLLSDLKTGFSDLIQQADTFSNILRRIAANYLQKLADRYFDKGMDSLLSGLEKANKARDTGGMEGYFNSLGQSLGSSFLDAVQNGWGLIKQLFGSLSLGNISSGASSAWNWASSLFSGFSSGFSFTGRAVGGAVSAGGAYIVGERGPEPFFPGVSGTVVPTSKLAEAFVDMLGVKAPVSVPAFSGMPSRGLGGSTTVQNDVSVAPQVHVSSDQVIQALKQHPEMRRYIVEVVAGSERAVRGGWRN